MNDATATQGLDPLAQLRELSTVVADTGDIAAVARRRLQHLGAGGRQLDGTL